jgi:succinate dehydrogenase / fumarate reductase, cytochrome b subunit
VRDNCVTIARQLPTSTRHHSALFDKGFFPFHKGAASSPTDELPMSSIHENRPLSPHLSVYRWQITNSLSILHRISGFGLTLGLIPLALWLWGAAYSPEWFACLSAIATSIPGKLFLFGWTLAFYYHLANGIRHLNWDIGHGFSLPEVLASGQIVIIFALAMTLFTWACISNIMGWFHG